ncbi:MAG: tetratricopeptide repeat protein [Planctomycetota bacterium]
MDAEANSDAFCRVRQQQREGQHQAAAAALRAHLQKQPGEGRLWALLGVSQWALGRVAESVASLETAQTLLPMGVEARLTLAQGYEAMGRRRLAADLYATIACEESPPDRLLPRLVDCLAGSHQRGLAIRVCQEAAQRAPGDPWPARAIARLLAKLGKPPEKIAAALQRAVQLDPHDVDTRLALAQHMHQCGRTGEAVDALSTVDIAGICCTTCLAAVRDIYAAAESYEDADRCKAALRRLTPPDCTATEGLG